MTLPLILLSYLGTYCYLYIGGRRYSTVMTDTGMQLVIRRLRRVKINPHFPIRSRIKKKKKKSSFDKPRTFGNYKISIDEVRGAGV